MTTYTVTSGATSNGLLIGPGNTEDVLSGGKATNTTVSGIGASQYVSSGGTASYTYMEDYGVQYVVSGGTAVSDTIGADSVGAVNSGGSTISTVVSADGEEQINGSASDSVVNGGGEQVIGAGAVVTSATLSGGLQIANGGGTVSDTIVDSGGAAYAGSGATVTGTTVNSGGLQQVGGSATYTYYYGSTTEPVGLSGGVVSDTTVNSGGIEYVSSGGTAIGTTDYGEMDITAGGVANVTSVGSGGLLLGAGGTDSGTVVDSGGLAQIGSTSLDIDTVVSTGGVQWLYTSATASNTTLSGGTQILGGVTSSVQFGAETPTGGGTALGNVVDAGGAEYVGTGATATGTVVNGGGVQQVGGSTTWNYYYAESSAETMSTNLSGGVVSNSIVSSGGTELVGSAGSAISVTVQSGGTETVDAGGVATSTTVIDGHVASGSGGLIINAGGAAIATTASGGETTGISILVNSGGTATGTILTAADQTVDSGGTASQTTVSSGGLLYLNSGSSGGSISGGVAYDTMVLSGGAEEIFDFAVETGGTVQSGGIIGVAGTIASETISFGGSGFLTVDGNGAHGSSISGTIFGSLTVSSGGSAISDTVMSGGYEWVDGGGSATNIIVSSSGVLVVSGISGSGAVSDGATVLSGGTETVFVSAVESGGTVDSGGKISVNGTIVDETISAGGAYFIGPYGGGSGIDSGSTVFGTGHIQGGSTETNDTVGAGGADIVSSGGTATSTTINSGGMLVISSGGSTADTTLQQGARIDVAYTPFVSGATVSLNASTDVLTVTDGGNTDTFQMAGSYTGEAFQLADDGSGGTLITLAPCYCAGTRILTDRGEVPVERLAAGDHLQTADGTTRRIKWVGHRRLDLARHPDPELAQPIRIRTDAFADGVPHRDLCVSPDHALLLDDMLVPARLLINGATVRREIACQTVTYYHVELDTHDILLAENLPAESYLDTGNRGMFENGDAGLILHPALTNDQNRRLAQSCRPFADAPALVEPIWRRLALRSVLLGFDLPPDVPTTTDPGLHVVIAGRTIQPINRQEINCQDWHYIFVLPPTQAPIHLVSRAVRPCDLKPWVEDHRRLGVRVSRLTLRFGDEVDLIPLDHPGMSGGWWAIEHDRSMLCRWTDGNAVIPPLVNGPVVLEITLAGTLDYPMGQQAASAAVHSTVLTKAA